jgi:hypothetical protein
MDELALGKGYLPVPQLSPVSTIPPMLHTHPHLHAALTKRTNGRSLGTFQKSSALSETGNHWIGKHFHLVIKWQTIERLTPLKYAVKENASGGVMQTAFQYQLVL